MSYVLTEPLLMDGLDAISYPWVARSNRLLSFCKVLFRTAYLS
jgi:hypothetical protein